MKSYKLTDEIKKDLKAAYPDITLKVYSFKEGMDIDIVFKQLTRDDVADILGESKDSSALSISDTHEGIYGKCVVWPDIPKEEIDALPIGYVPTVSKVIQEKSGYKKMDISGRIIGPETTVWTISESEGWGDPTADEIIALRQQFKDYGLKRVKMDKYVFIIKPVLRGDMNLANLAIDSGLSICQSSVVWPDPSKLITIGAGYIQELLEIAVSFSGWDEAVTLEVEDL